MKRLLVHLLVALAVAIVYRAVMFIVDEHLRNDETILM